MTGDDSRPGDRAPVGGRRARWRGAVAAAVVLAGAGAWLGDGALVLAGTIPLAYLASGSLSAVEVPELAVERSVAPSPAPPGRPVGVTLSVTNETERTLSDVRVVDGVPGDLAVLDGSPRAGVALEPGETWTGEYTFVARRGEYRFDPPRVRVRGTGGGAVATTTRPAEGDDRLVCRFDAEAPPVTDEGTDHIGQLSSDDPGAGLTFHSSREYRHGDPADRINWRQYAKRGELATINYEQWVSTTVVLVLDARPACQVGAGPGRPSAVEIGAYAATQAMTALLRAGHDVAVAAVGVDGSGPAGTGWVGPGRGREQRERALSLFETASEAGGSNPERNRRGFRKVAELAGPDAELLLVSPLLDDVPVEAVTEWQAFGHTRTVLSPDVVPDNTVSGRVEAVRRRTRLARCQSTGARVVDWRRGTPLPVVLDHALDVAARDVEEFAHAGASVTPTTREGGR